jgi:transcriptional regulator with XRE-family HTH domain
MRRYQKANFYRLRKELGLTLRKLMFATGVPASELSQFEHGRIRRNKKIEMVIKYMEDQINAKTDQIPR